jgi:DNA-binding transcriptional MocR family regulator
VAQGVLRAGDRIPSVRKASAHYHVSSATVLAAYAMLEARGLVEARPQSGYYVRPQFAGAAVLPRGGRVAAAAAPVVVGELAFRILGASRDLATIPLGSAFPSPELFPLRALNRTLAAVARKQEPWQTVTDLPPGNHELRRLIAKRYLEHGYVVGEDEIIITCGAMEALNLGLQAVARAGDIVAVESPAFYAGLQAIERLGMRALEIPTDAATGIDLDALARALQAQAARGQPVKACLVMSTFQNPLGATMPEERKRALVALLARHKVPLVEDDVYAELHYGAQHLRAAKAFDTKGMVIHCGSFAKCLAPGYRVGWMAAGRFAARASQLKFMTTLATAVLPQAAIAEFLKYGGYDGHLRRLRHALAQQMQQMHAALAQALPAGARLTRPQGGYMLWVELPAGVDALALFDAALARSISIAPGPIFSGTRRYRNFIRINCGHPWSPAIDGAVKWLGQAASAAAG